MYSEMLSLPSTTVTRRVPIQCRDGADCKRPGCHFLHPGDEIENVATIPVRKLILIQLCQLANLLLLSLLLVQICSKLYTARLQVLPSVQEQVNSIPRWSTCSRV
jgi:hypothetical protein